MDTPDVVGGMPAERKVDEFTVTITRSAGSDGAIVFFIDGPFGVDGNAPLRVIVNDEGNPVYAEAEHASWNTISGNGESWTREAESVTLTVKPEDIGYTGFHYDGMEPA